MLQSARGLVKNRGEASVRLGWRRNIPPFGVAGASRLPYHLSGRGRPDNGLERDAPATALTLLELPSSPEASTSFP